MDFRLGILEAAARCSRVVAAAAMTVAIIALWLPGRLTAQSENDADPAAIFNEAQDLHAKGNLAGAIKLYEKALKAEPNFPEAEYQRAAAELSLGHADASERGFRKALELRPDWALPLTSLGSLLIDRGKTAEAETLLVRAADLEPNNAAALIALTEIRIGSSAPAAALDELLAKITRLTAQANGTASLWAARAAIESALQRRPAAKQSISRALALDPRSRPALRLRGEIAAAEGDYATAGETASVLEAIPGSADDGKLLRARALAAEGKLAEAVAALDAISKPNSAQSDLRAKINAARSTSTADLEKQLEKTPKDAVVLGRLCTMYRRESPEKALLYCRQASEIEPANPAHAIGFAAALVQAKQYAPAIGLLRKLLEIVPENFTAHANLATALFQSKQYEAASEEFRWLIAKQPDTAGPYFFLAIIQDESGLYPDALASYQQYLRLADPAANRLDIERVNLRLPLVQKLAKDKKK